MFQEEHNDMETASLPFLR